MSTGHSLVATAAAAEAVEATWIAAAAASVAAGMASSTEGAAVSCQGLGGMVCATPCCATPVLQRLQRRPQCTAHSRQGMPRRPSQVCGDAFELYVCSATKVRAANSPLKTCGVAPNVAPSRAARGAPCRRRCSCRRCVHVRSRTGRTEVGRGCSAMRLRGCSWCGGGRHH